MAQIKTFSSVLKKCILLTIFATALFFGGAVAFKDIGLAYLGAITLVSFVIQSLVYIVNESARIATTKAVETSKNWRMTRLKELLTVVVMYFFLVLTLNKFDFQISIHKYSLYILPPLLLVGLIFLFLKNTNNVSQKMKSIFTTVLLLIYSLTLFGICFFLSQYSILKLLSNYF